MKIELEKQEERWIGTASASEYDNFEIVKEAQDRGFIKVDFKNIERWRSPEQTAKILEEIAEVIRANF